MSKKQTEKLGFQAEVKQLLQLVTHSLYSNREIFLRELISNSSDAADKLRFEALANSELYEGDSELKIWVKLDPQAKTITVRDNGIGMSWDEVVENLGTIAKSGTREFLAALGEAKGRESNLIGQFGVGFYSSFVVAEQVEVRTRRAGLRNDEGVCWQSDGAGEFTISPLELNQRGTEVILHLKAEDEDLLDHWRIRQIITKYSDHIILPIVMDKPGTNADEGATEETVNKATALWTLAKGEIKDEDYQSFYRHVSHDFEDPLVWSHNRVEGAVEYTSLLYIPQHAPMDFWTQERKQGLKLYVQRVFIMDNATQLLPNYLRFVRGVIDARDLPLNVSREILQHNRVIEQIRSGVVKRVLDMLEKLAASEAEKYTKFWQALGGALKEGIVEDVANRERIAQLMRFASTYTGNKEQQTTLADYIKRCAPEQERIYYIAAESFEAARHSPYLDIFRKNDIEVLLLSDRIDEWWLSHYREYQGKRFESITKEDLDLGNLVKRENEENKEQLQTDYQAVLEHIQQILVEKIAQVRLSDRLTEAPACLVTSEHDLSFNMQRIMATLGQNLPQSKPILEINPHHPLVKKLRILNSDDAAFTAWVTLFYEQAVLIAGGKLEDVAAFTQRINQLLSAPEVVTTE